MLIFIFYRVQLLDVDGHLTHLYTNVTGKFACSNLLLYRKQAC